MKKLNIFILIFLLGFGYGCSGIQSRKTISDISDVSDETKAQVTIEDLEGQTVRTHVQNIDDNFDEIYALVDTGSASFTGMSGSVITSGTVSESYIDSSLTRTTAIDTAAELESVANLGAYASDILGCTNLAALMTLINGGAYSPTAALDFSGASSITSGPMAFSGTVTLPETPTDGQLTQYTGGAIDLFTFYNGSAWNYFVATNTAPSDDGYIPVYRTATGIGWEAQSGGGDVTASSTTTFTNKTIDANGTGNSITNIETDDISATTLITSSEIGTTATDAQVPTWKAVKDYLDSIIVSGNPTISITTPSADGTWVDSLTYTAFAGTAFDLQGISEIAWKLESEGTYATTGVSGTTNWTVSSITLSEGANELYARVTDTNANTAEDNLTINADITDPVGVADADGTHSGTGDSITSGIDWTETNLDTSTVACTVVNATPTSPTVTCVGNACDTETLTPDGEGTVTCTWNADDLAGNSATPIVQEFTYSGGGASATDDFNRASIGTDWTTLTNQSTLTINSSTLVAGSSSGRNGMYYNATTFTDDQSSQITITTNHDNNCGPAVRMSASAETAYVAVMSIAASTVTLRKLSAGTFSDITSVSETCANGDTLKISVSGTTLTVDHNGSQIISTTDSDISTGQPGIFIYSTVARGDDWEGSDL